MLRCVAHSEEMNIVGSGTGDQGVLAVQTGAARYVLALVQARRQIRVGCISSWGGLLPEPLEPWCRL